MFEGLDEVEGSGKIWNVWGGAEFGRSGVWAVWRGAMFGGFGVRGSSSWGVGCALGVGCLGIGEGG